MNFLNFKKKEGPINPIIPSQENIEKYFNISTTPDSEIKEMLIKLCSPYQPTPEDIQKIEKEMAEVKNLRGSEWYISCIDVKLFIKEDGEIKLAYSNAETVNKNAKEFGLKVIGD